MNVQGINLGTSAAALGAAPAATTTKQTSNLGSTDFMKLLLTQLQNQDPLQPTDSTQFLSQLSQFSTLSGIQQLNSSFTNLLQLQQLTQGAGLIGKTVSYQKPGTTGVQKGTVDSVNFQNGQLQLMIGGSAIGLGQVQSILQK